MPNDDDCKILSCGGAVSVPGLAGCVDDELPPIVPASYAPVRGCKNPAAQNFNPQAVEDDGSCIFPDPYSYSCG